MNRLVLIDGNAILHRAYHAIPPLTAPDGSVVNAVYGFGTMLVRLIGDLTPTHVAVAFDRPKPTFRKELFAGYQSKRPEMDDLLVEQIPKVHKLVESFGIPIFEMDGFEADDVIGTLAKRVHVIPANAGIQSKILDPRVKPEDDTRIDQVIIVTGDRDILQLVEDEKILVYMPTKGLSEAKLYGEKEVKERLGVAPKNVADLKALSGDSSDNYPGVAGIGPKTAVSLIDVFGSTEGLYEAIKNKDERLSKFSAGVLAKLETGTKDAVLFKTIASIRCDVPIVGDLTPLGSLNRPESVAALTGFGFRKLLGRITGADNRTQNTEPNDQAEKKKQKQKAGKQQELF